MKFAQKYINLTCTLTLISLWYFCYYNPLQANIQKNFQHLKVSIIIPCYWKHFVYLENLLDLFAKQTVLPEEIVISLSETNKINKNNLDLLEAKAYPFLVKIIKHTEKLFAGANRNSACQNASGDILILNDADDLPHIQRIEIIRHIFEVSDAQMVMHKYTTDENFDIMQKNLANNIYWENLIERPCPWYRSQNDYLHNGNIAIRKTSLPKIQWGNMPGEDCNYNQHFFDKIGKIYITNACLIQYRPKLGTGGYTKMRKN